MNAELKNFEDVTLLNNVSDGLFPLIWIEEVSNYLKFHFTFFSNQIKKYFASIEKLHIVKTNHKCALGRKQPS